MKRLTFTLLLIALALLSGIAEVRATSLDGYKETTVRDVLIDAPRLSSVSAPVKITGVYTRHGRADVLYGNEDAAAAINDKYIGLMTDQAPENIRAIMFDCSSTCKLTVWGTVSECTGKNLFGAELDVPCVDVEGGTNEPWLTIEKQQQADEAAQAAEARQRELEAEAQQEAKAEADAQQQRLAQEEQQRQLAADWRLKVSQCLSNPNQWAANEGLAWTTCAYSPTYGWFPIGMPPDPTPEMQRAIGWCIAYFTRPVRDSENPAIITASPSYRSGYSVCLRADPPAQSEPKQQATSPLRFEPVPPSSPPDTPAFEQRLEDCIRSPAMAEVGNAYGKCVAKVSTP